MIKRASIWLGSAALVIGAAHAVEPISVTAGEHDSFSRIVVSGGAKGVFVDKAGRTVDIQFTGTDAAFDLSDVNDKRKAHRVIGASKIEGSNGVLVRLRLNCDCKVESTQKADGRLIVDIADGARAPSAVAAAKAADAGETHEASSQAAASHAAPAEAPASKQAASQSPAEAVDTVSVEEARDRMRTLLQRAANEGFITLRAGEGDVKEAASEAAPADHAATPTAPQLANATSPAPQERRTEPAPRVATAPCLPDEDLALPIEEIEKNPLGVITDLRDEFETADEGERAELLVDYAKAYMAISFGEEALAVLADNGADDTIFADMARIIAERPVSEKGPLLGARECHGAHALWQAAADTPEEASAAYKRSGEVLSTLPVRLRTLLAVRIAMKLIDAGSWNDVRQLYRIAEEGAQYAPEDVQYIAAKLLEHEGRTQEAEDLLRMVAAGDSEAAKEALLSLANRYAAGEEAHEGFLDDLGALAMTERGTAEGGEAAVHEAKIWADAGNIEAGVFLLRSAVESDGADPVEAARNAQRMLGASFGANDNAERLAALRTYLDNRDFVEQGTAVPALRAAAAKAAYDVGVPNLAISLMTDDDGIDITRTLLRARAALAANAPQQALALAAPYADDPDFAAVIVSANLALNQNYAALAAASALKDGPVKATRMADAAWRAGDWASAVRAFQKIDPASMSAEDALHYALSAYMAHAEDAPLAAKAVLRRDESPYAAGVESLFSKDPGGALLDRGKALVDSTDEDINMAREALNHG